MTISLSPARPFAALTALAVIAAGIALAPVASAGAASTASQSSSVVSKINSYRTSAKLAKVKTQNDVTEFANGIADVMAAQNQPDFEKVSFGSVQFIVAEPEQYEFLGFRVTGGSSAVATNVTKKIKALSSKTNKKAIYGAYNYVGVGLQKKGSYTYVMAFFAKYSQAKLQDSKEPKIGGIVAVGKTLTIDMNGWAVSGGQRTYSWNVDGSGAGEANSPLVITADMVGKKIFATVSVERDGYYPISRSTDSAKVAKGTIGTTPTPKITGSRVVGSTLTTTAGTWSTGTELTYKWKRNGVTIPDATSTTYAQVAADLGKKITVSVTGTKPGYTTVTKTSSAPSATLGAFEAPQPDVSLAGPAAAGSTFTVSVGTWSPKASAYTYQWYRDGVAISKATAKTYKTVAADVEKTITVTVTGKKTGYKTLSVTSSPFYFGVAS